MSIASIAEWEGGVTMLTTDGCGCCSTSIPIAHPDARTEALESIALVLQYCEETGANLGRLVDEARETWK